MVPVGREDLYARIDRALDAVQRSGTDLLVENRKTCAIVADLIAEPKLDTHAEIIALRSVLATLGRSGARPGGSARRPVADELIGADGALGAETVDAVVDVVAGRLGLSLVDNDEGSDDGSANSSPPPAPWRPRAGVIAGLAVALLVVVGGVAGWLAFVDPAGQSNDGDERHDRRGCEPGGQREPGQRRAP